MRLPTIQGIIRRRILANFRVDPQVMQQQLPSRFRPKLHNGFAVAGICMIRLDHIRPKMMPENGTPLMTCICDVAVFCSRNSTILSRQHRGWMAMTTATFAMASGI
jgi:Uncharacterized conserved protein (COG2071)